MARTIVVNGERIAAHHTSAIVEAQSGSFESFEIDCRICGDWEEAAYFNDGSPMPICVFCAFH